MQDYSLTSALCSPATTGDSLLHRTPPFSQEELRPLELGVAACEIYPIAYGLPPPCLALAQKSVPKSSENRSKSVRIEAQGTSWGRCGALLGFPLAQRAENIQNVSSWTALRGPSETANLKKLGRRCPNASQSCVQNWMSESCSKNS